MSASAIEWWFSISESDRVAILMDADAGDWGAQESIVDVEEALDSTGQESLQDWIADVRSAL